MKKNAIILAAGKSSRFAPFTYEKPKGLFCVKGQILIERQIEQLIEAGIDEIYIVVGYMKEKFFYLEQKYLSKLFKNYIGQGFVEYVTNKRIEKAKKLLANTNYTISEIAEQVAYEDANYFSVVFKRNVGITPREYRMKYQK